MVPESTLEWVRLASKVSPARYQGTRRLNEAIWTSSSCPGEVCNCTVPTMSRSSRLWCCITAPRRYLPVASEPVLSSDTCPTTEPRSATRSTPVSWPSSSVRKVTCISRPGFSLASRNSEASTVSTGVVPSCSEGTARRMLAAVLALAPEISTFSILSSSTCRRTTPASSACSGMNTCMAVMPARS